MGEGGTIGAPAAVLNAVNDALAQVGASVGRIPVRPADVVAAIAEAASRDPVDSRRETQ